MKQPTREEQLESACMLSLMSLQGVQFAGWYKGYSACPDCCGYPPNHEKGCELIETIRILRRLLGQRELDDENDETAT